MPKIILLLLVITSDCSKLWLVPADKSDVPSQSSAKGDASMKDFLLYSKKAITAKPP